MTDTSHAFFDDPAACRSALERIRLGQPSGELMMLLGSRPREILDFLAGRFSERAGVVRLIEGAMGSGKTTLLNLIEGTAIKQNAVPIKNVIAHANYASMKGLFAMTFVRKEFYQAAILSLKDKIESGEEDAASKVIALTRDCRIGKVFEGMARLAKAAACDGFDCSTAGEKIAAALFSLVVNGRVTPIREVLSGFGVDARSISALAAEEINDLLRSHIRFFDACGIYPVWLVDEFESVCGLYASQSQNMLGFYRDMLDSIMESEKGSGALFLFSTPDGVRKIASYPAFIDRLRGSPLFTLSSPTWRMVDMAKWEPSVVIPLIEKMYWGASFAGDLGAKAVTENLEISRGERFAGRVESTIQNEALEPRVRLKRLVCEMYDLLECSRVDIESFLVSLEEDESKVKDAAVTYRYEGSILQLESQEHVIQGAGNNGPISDVSETTFIRPALDAASPLMFSHVKGYEKEEVLLEGIKKAMSPHVLAERISRYRNQGGRAREIYELCGLEMVGLDDLRSQLVWEILDGSLSKDGILKVLIEKRAEGGDAEATAIPEGERTTHGLIASIKELGRIIASGNDSGLKKDKPAKMEKVEELLDIASSPSMLRHVAYTLLCRNNILLEDGAVDRVILALMSKYRNYKPLPSRYGVFFKVGGRGVSGSDEDYTCITDRLDWDEDALSV